MNASMPVETLNAVSCPRCGGNNIACGGAIVRCRPVESRNAHSPRRRFQRVLERKYACRDCERRFSEDEVLTE